jgi:hypothetical protein
LFSNLILYYTIKLHNSLALKRAALEAFEGRYETEELAAMVEEQEILSQSLELIQR